MSASAMATSAPPPHGLLRRRRLFAALCRRLGFPCHLRGPRRKRGKTVSGRQQELVPRIGVSAAALALLPSLCLCPCPSAMLSVCMLFSCSCAVCCSPLSLHAMGNPVLSTLHTFLNPPLSSSSSSSSSVGRWRDRFAAGFFLGFPNMFAKSMPPSRRRHCQLSDTLGAGGPCHVEAPSKWVEAGGKQQMAVCEWTIANPTLSIQL